MLSHFSNLLRDRINLEDQYTSATQSTQVALWHERLAELDAKYNI